MYCWSTGSQWRDIKRGITTVVVVVGVVIVVVVVVVVSISTALLRIQSIAISHVVLIFPTILWDRYYYYPYMWMVMLRENSLSKST